MEQQVEKALGGAGEVPTRDRAAANEQEEAKRTLVPDGSAPTRDEASGGPEAGEEAQADAGADAGQEASSVEEVELAENNALALVFEDVRRQSSDSELVSPSRWEELELVPEHMTPEDFEMFVYEYLEDWREEHRSEEEEAASLTLTGASTQGPASGTTSAASAPAPHIRSKYASRSVGVPTLFAKRKEAGEQAAEDAGAGVAAAGTAADAEAAAMTSDATGAAAAAKTSLVATAAVRADADASAGELGLAATEDRGAAAAAGMPSSSSAGSANASDDPYPGLNIPDGYELREIEGEWTLVQVDPNPPTPRLEVNPAHIKTLVGAHSYYLYDAQAMTDTYANWAFLAAEDNPLVTFAFCVREDSRVYPRPMPAQSLRNAPFRMSIEEIEHAWQLSREHADYADIVRIEASNGDVYFYSTDYLSAARAEALAEWDAVERYRNV